MSCGPGTGRSVNSYRQTLPPSNCIGPLDPAAPMEETRPMVQITPEVTSTEYIGTDGQTEDSTLALETTTASQEAEPIRFQNKNEQTADVWRNVWSAAQTTGTVSASFDNAGTRLDGETGPVITVTNTLTNLEQRVIWVDSGIADPANTGRFRVDAFDGSQIDLVPVYHGGIGSGDTALVAEGPVADVVIRVGETIWDRPSGNERRVYFENHQTNTSGTHPYESAGGFVGSGQTLTLSSGVLNIATTWTGTTQLFRSATTVGDTTTVPLAAQANPVITSNQVVEFRVNGSIVLGCDAGTSQAVLTQFTETVAATIGTADDAATCAKRAGVASNDLTFNLEFTAYNDHATIEAINLIADSKAAVPIDLVMRDSLGNEIERRWPVCKIYKNGPQLGSGEAFDTAPFRAVCVRHSVDVGTSSWQNLAAA